MDGQSATLFVQDLELLARQRHVLDNACLTLKTHSLAGNLDLFYLFGSICICWKVIWAFFEVHLPATFVVDRLEYKWIRTQKTKNFWAETASHEGWVARPLSIVSLKCPWLGQMGWKGKCSRQVHQNIHSKCSNIQICTSNISQMGQIEWQKYFLTKNYQKYLRFKKHIPF